jgi:hypothetical protein
MFAIPQRQPCSSKAWAGARDVSATYEQPTNACEASNSISGAHQETGRPFLTD